LWRAWLTAGFALGGFVAGEGWFGTKRRATAFVANGAPRLTFVFAIAVAQRDRPLLEALVAFLGHGRILDRARRRPHHEPISELSISSSLVHRRATIPFAEHFLLPSAKRRQFEHWRAQLEAYEAERPSQWRRGPSPCSIDGCEKPVRGRGLCRSHYYRATGY
jgi:hypothetical protein